MSVSDRVLLANKRAELLGADVPTVSGVVTPAVSKIPVGVTKVSTRVASQTMVPGTAVADLATVFKGCVSLKETVDEMTVVSESDDKRVKIAKRETADEAYGLVSIVSVDDRFKAAFCHYPVHFMDEETLTSYVEDYACGKSRNFNGFEIENLRLQFEGLLIKVVSDNSGFLRFVTKKKAQLCKEQEKIFLDTLVQNHAEMAGISDLEVARASVFAAMLAYTHANVTLTFRLVHPAVSYVRGPLDLSKNKPKAILVQWNDKHIDNQRELPLTNVFMTSGDVVFDCELETFGAVMVEMKDPKMGLTHYAKLVSQRRHQQLLQVEGVNGNFQAFVNRLRDSCKDVTEFEGKCKNVRMALNPFHLPAFERAVIQLTEGAAGATELVASFLKRNMKELLNEKSDLVAALKKMDFKKAEKLITAAGMYKTRYGSVLKFIQGMKQADVDRHNQLLTVIADNKLDHPNAAVSAAARLIKSCL